MTLARDPSRAWQAGDLNRDNIHSLVRDAERMRAQFIRNKVGSFFRRFG